MVTSVTSVPYYSYLNQLQGISDTGTNPAATAPAAVAPTTSTTGTTSTSNAQAGTAALSSLLSNPSAFSPEVLGLLQSDSSSGIDSLLGESSIGTNDPLTGLLDSLYANSASAAVTQASDNVTSANPSVSTTSSGSGTAATGASLVDSLVNSITQASISYNNTNLQNIQNNVAANSYGPDGTTPLTA